MEKDKTEVYDMSILDKKYEEFDVEALDRIEFNNAIPSVEDQTSKPDSWTVEGIMKRIKDYYGKTYKRDIKNMQIVSVEESKKSKKTIIIALKK